MGNLTKIVYLSNEQATTLFANNTITVDGTTINYSADDLYVTPDAGYLPLTGGSLSGALTLAANPTANLQAATKQYVDTVAGNYVLKAGDTMTGALKAKGLRTYVSDSAHNASLNFGETADSTRVGRITMNTETSRMVFQEGNEEYFLPTPVAESQTQYNIVTTKGSYTLGDTLLAPKFTAFDDSYPSLSFATETTKTTDLGSINYDVTNKQIFFNCYTGGGGAEMFKLPTTTYTDSNWYSYDILTTKDKAVDDKWTIKSVNNVYPRISFTRPADTTNSLIGEIYLITDDNASVSRFLFRSQHRDGTYTDFYLPQIARTSTTAKTWHILTNAAPVTIAQGGTGATSVDSITVTAGDNVTIFRSYSHIWGKLVCLNIDLVISSTIANGTSVFVLSSNVPYVTDQTLDIPLVRVSATGQNGYVKIYNNTRAAVAGGSLPAGTYLISYSYFVP